MAKEATTPERKREPVKMINAAISKTGDDTVLRGVLLFDTLQHIKIGDYQRECLEGRTKRALMRATKMEPTGMEDIVLGMRGDDYAVRDGVYFLHDPVYVVDGLQRLSAVIAVGDTQPELHDLLRLGATVHFNTSDLWERAKFRDINEKRTPVSSNVLIRNARHEHPIIEMFYALCENDPTFALYRRVTWTQRMRAGEVISAASLVRFVARLHAAFGPGRGRNIDELVSTLDTTVKAVGRNVMRSNAKELFEILDECWGVRNVAYRGATHLRFGFLRALVAMFANHPHVFFKDRRLTVDAATKRKLKSFPIGDPQVIRLAGSAGQATELLYSLLIKHINSGRRTRRLQEMAPMEPDSAEGAGAGGGDADEPVALAAKA